MTNKKQKIFSRLPIVLTVIDGWGIGKPGPWNVLSLAKISNYKRLLENFPNTQLQAAGVDVGLSKGQDGNSEAGHMNIGAGRIVLQDSVYISRAINDGTFFKNPAFLRAVRHVKKHHSTLHLMGMMGNSESAHANPDHLLALLTFAQLCHLPKIALHIFTDGRDSPRFSAVKMLKRLEKIVGRVKIASVTGRYFAMDRALHWGRIEKVYEMLTLGKTQRKIFSAEQAILNGYNHNESDEFIEPTLVVANKKPLIIKDNDSIIFFNLRSDRARQLTKAFVQPNFIGFKRKKILKNLVFVAMTDFGPDLPGVLSAYPSRDIAETLPMVLKGFRQLYISESEKYAHMTYFFNGGYDHPVGGEDRVSISSPKVATYNLRPGMSTLKLVHFVKKDLQKKAHDFICINFAAPDMVAHTGHLKASIKAAEVVDKGLAELKKAVFKARGTLIVTADHGNIEELKNPRSGEIDTEHSNNPVPFILVNNHFRKCKLKKSGRLADIAPTILHLINVEKPALMTGKSLIIKKP